MNISTFSSSSSSHHHHHHVPKKRRISYQITVKLFILFLKKADCSIVVPSLSLSLSFFVCLYANYEWTIWMVLKGCVNRDKISEDVVNKRKLKWSFTEAKMFLVCYEYLTKAILNNYTRVGKTIGNEMPIVVWVVFNHLRRHLVEERKIVLIETCAWD